MATSLIIRLHGRFISDLETLYWPIKSDHSVYSLIINVLIFV